MDDIRFLAALKRISWSGIPKEFRLVAWQLLLVCISLFTTITLLERTGERMELIIIYVF